MRRRTFNQRIRTRWYVFGFFTFCVLVYSVLLEPNSLSIDTVQIFSDKLYSLLSNKTVVHISDLHITSFAYREKKLIKALNRIRPDILFITGDFLSNGRDVNACVQTLSQIITPPLGIWAVLGNTDHSGEADGDELYDVFISRLEDLGVVVLRDEGKRITINDGNESIWIVGVENSYLSNGKLNWLLKGAKENEAIILLSHYPDVLTEHADALAINLQESENAPISGWGWQNNAYFEYDTGIVRFSKNGRQKIRIQRREDGVAIEKICLIPESPNNQSDFSENPKSFFDLLQDLESADGAIKDIVSISSQDILRRDIFGSWEKEADATSSLGYLIDLPDQEEKEEFPRSEPKNYFEATFFAKADVNYHIWIKMKATKDRISSDSVYVQFDNAIDEYGNSIYHINQKGIRSNLFKIDLILAGHTHGGQVRLPFVGTLNIIPDHNVEYDMGLFERNGTKMYVNRGIGTSLVPVRLFCPPEITVFKFIRETNDSM